MADRFLTKKLLQAGVDWPKDAKFDEYVSTGDLDQWVSRYHVETATPAAELLDRLDAGARKSGLWKAAGPHRWANRQEGREVALTFATQPGVDASHFDLDITLKASLARP